MVICKFYIPLSDSTKWLEFDYLNANYNIKTSYDFSLFNEVNHMRFALYKDEYGIEPILLIWKNGDVKIGNETFNSRRQEIPDSASGFFPDGWSDARFGEYLVQRVRQLVFMPAGSRDDFRFYVGDESGCVSIRPCRDQWTLTPTGHVALANLRTFYHITDEEMSMFADSLGSILLPLFSCKEKIYDMINYINTNYRDGWVVNDASILIGGKPYEIKQSKRGKYYLANFPAEHRTLLKSYIRVFFPEKKFMGIFPEFETKDELLKFVNTIKNDRRFSERKDS